MDKCHFRKAELELKIRKRVACEEKAHRIVERLLDNPIETEFLIDCVSYKIINFILLIYWHRRDYETSAKLCNV